jgi:hypothetical protein
MGIDYASFYDFFLIWNPYESVEKKKLNKIYVSHYNQANSVITKNDKIFNITHTLGHKLGTTSFSV